MTAKSIEVLLLFVGVCFACALSGAFFRPGHWYETLNKPSWQPPRWLFAPAWTFLYLTIAVSGWLLWRQAGFSTTSSGAFLIYFGSLLLNAAWSFCFFRLHRPDVAFVDVVALWLSIVATIMAFYPIDKSAAVLLVPYLLWVTFAATLNLKIWQLNKNQTASGLLKKS